MVLKLICDFVSISIIFFMKLDLPVFGVYVFNIEMSYQLIR